MSFSEHWKTLLKMMQLKQETFWGMELSQLKLFSLALARKEGWGRGVPGWLPPHPPDPAPCVGLGPVHMPSEMSQRLVLTGPA